MEHDNILIVLYVLVFVISVLAPVFKKKKKEEAPRHNEISTLGSDIEDNDIISRIVVSPSKAEPIRKQTAQPAQKKAYVLPEEGIRITKAKSKPITTMETQREELNKKKERLRNAIIYGEILAPKF